MVQLGELVLWLGLALSPAFVPILLLNLRDRRESVLLGAVWEQLSSPDLRGRIAVRVRYALLRRASFVALDMRDCSQEEIWAALTRLSQNLPPHVRVTVDAAVGRQVPVRVALEGTGRHQVAHASRLLATAG